MKTDKKLGTGKITQVVGVVVDVEFSGGTVPAIYNALTCKVGDRTLWFEVALHLSESSVRAVSLGATEGLVRGTEVSDTGAPVQVPIGPETEGRMFNVIGEPIDGKPAPKGAKRAPIHRKPPTLSEQSTETEILETGIKVIDLI